MIQRSQAGGEHPHCTKALGFIGARRPHRRPCSKEPTSRRREDKQHFLRCREIVGRSVVLEMLTRDKNNIADEIQFLAPRLVIEDRRQQ
jgi:hypothetical protein